MSSNVTAAASARRPRSRALRIAAAPLTVAALTVGGLPLAAAAEAETGERRSRPAAGCLWAGTTYPQQSTVVAGGVGYTCGTEAGAPHWFAGAVSGKASTVPTPGAIANPTGQFSSGARQPGTAYTDYCVGNQLIPGTDDVYQVVRTSGGLLWKAATPIGQWKFDTKRPAETWRTPSLCIDGTLT